MNSTNFVTFKEAIENGNTKSLWQRTCRYRSWS